MFLDGAGELKRLLRPGLDDAAAAFLVQAEAVHKQAPLRFSHAELEKLKSLLEPGRDDAAAKFLEDAKAAEEALRSQNERLAKLQRVAGEPPAATPQVVAAAAAAQTVVVHRISFQEAEDTADGSASPERSTGTDAGDLSGQQQATMAVEEAQRTAVLRVPGFLSPAEVAAVHAAAENIIAEKAAAAAAAAGGAVIDPIIGASATAPVRSSPAWETGRKWNVSFLHKGGMFADKLPEIRAKILELGRKADA